MSSNCAQLTGVVLLLLLLTKGQAVNVERILKRLFHPEEIEQESDSDKAKRYEVADWNYFEDNKERPMTEPNEDTIEDYENLKDIPVQLQKQQQNELRKKRLDEDANEPESETSDSQEDAQSRARALDKLEKKKLQEMQLKPAEESTRRKRTMAMRRWGFR